MGEIFLLAQKDLKLLLRDPRALITLFLNPLIFIVIMSLALAPAYRSLTSSAIHLLVADCDRGEGAREILQALKGIKGLRVEEIPGLGTREAEGVLMRRIEEGKGMAALLIPSGFSARLSRHQEVALPLFLEPTQPLVPEVAEGIVEGVAQGLSVEVRLGEWLGETLSLFVFDLEGLSREKTGKAWKEMAQEEKRKARAHPLIKVQGRVVGKAPVGERPDIYSQNVPGYTTMFVFFLVSFVAISLLAERQEGTLRRLLSAPVGRWALLGGKLIQSFLVGLAQVSILFSVGHLAFGMSLGHSPLGLILLALGLSFTATSLGILVAAWAKTEAQAYGIGVLLVVSLAALGGCFFPTFLMPEFMQYLAHLTPHAWAMEGFQGLIVRGQGVAEILPQIGMLWAFGTAFFLMALGCFQWE
ncbi:MAG: ABC transporter permease [Candidatus Tectomicrobia bacterium]|uniref:ABC transporter permease n=1 Tax=Tectimicrobiota bacterium TaxID=2528274 RepID=A0A932FY28_UNCTE|nr:ABC transporter permease [Candidatus Tectomicrobia bacterium]